jgi:hypothetical protein
MTTCPISEEQALFLATLPDVFCDLAYAIRVHSFVNRVAVISEDAARDAIDFGSRAALVEADPEGNVRLAEWLRRRRDALEASEGLFELAVGELSDVILEHAAGRGCT